MNRLEKTENQIDGLNSRVNTLWMILIVLFAVFSLGYIRLHSRLNSLEGRPQLIQSPIKTNII